LCLKQEKAVAMGSISFPHALHRCDFHTMNTVTILNSATARNISYRSYSKKSLDIVINHSIDINDEAEYIETAAKTHEMDVQCFGSLPGFAAVDIPRGLSTKWVSVNPDIYTYIFDHLTDRVIGYINAMPLKEPVFRKVISGDLNDNDITADDVVPYDSGEKIYLYIMSIAIEPGARRLSQGIYQEGFELLFAALERKITEYWINSGTRVVELGAVGWTADGRRMCDMLGLRRRTVDRQGNPTYSLRVDEASRRNKHLGGVLNRLKTRYETTVS
jgi:hypothetical protein